MNVPIPTTAPDWGKEASEQRRKARNRAAQRNYRKNIKDRLRELELLRAQQGHVGAGDAGVPGPQLSIESDGMEHLETELGMKEIPPHLVACQRPESPGQMRGWTESETQFGSQTQQLDKTPDFDLGWSGASTLTPSLPRGLTLDDSLDRPSQIDLIQNGSTISPDPWGEPSNDTNNQNFPGRTPLHKAAAGGHTSVLKLLLARGATITAVDENGQTILHLAVRYGHESTVRYILEQRIAVDSRDHSGNTALHLAAENGSEAIVEALLCAGASVNSVAHSF